MENFDNFLNSLLQMCFIMTMDGWTQIMEEIEMTFTNFS